MPKTNLKLALVTGGMALVGLVAGVATIASAQTSTTTNTPVVTTSGTTTTGVVDKPESANDPADTDTGSQTHGHAPLGGDGVVTSISGTTIVVGEESNEGGASYTVDASGATVTNNGAAATLADIKVGDKIFVKGTVNGTNVSATSVSLGHPGGHGKEGANDTDGGAASEASEGPSTSGGADQ